MADDVAGLTPVPLTDVLRRILEREEISILFQPIFDLRTGAPHGFEALARGPRETALEDYASLYRAANTADLLPELDRVCRRRAILAGTNLPADYKLFVKMFPVSVGDESFCGKELIFLLQGELTPAQLVWQISEHDPVENFSRFMDSVTDLTELGCKLALDNFGRGYSGLDKLVHIGPNYIKMARELTHDIHTSSVKQQYTFDLLDIGPENRGEFGNHGNGADGRVGGRSQYRGQSRARLSPG